MDRSNSATAINTCIWSPPAGLSFEVSIPWSKPSHVVGAQFRQSGRMRQAAPSGPA